MSSVLISSPTAIEWCAKRWGGVPKVSFALMDVLNMSFESTFFSYFFHTPFFPGGDSSDVVCGWVMRMV